MTVVVPAVAAVPSLRTASVKLPLPPTGKVPECDLSIARSVAVTVVGSASVSLTGFGSASWPVPEVATVALFETSGIAAWVTSVVIVIVGSDSSGCITVGFVQVTSWPLTLQFQPPPLADWTGSSAGTVSVTVVVPAVGSAPSLVTSSS